MEKCKALTGLAVKGLKDSVLSPLLFAITTRDKILNIEESFSS